jgi:hypothetical protein
VPSRPIARRGSIGLIALAAAVAFGSRVAALPAWAAAPLISGVTVDHVTPTSAEITWTTDVPATTQLVLMDVEYQPLRRFPEPKDANLTTAHSVTVANLVPNTKYWYYVAAEDAAGTLTTTYDPNHQASFTTLAIDPQGSFDYRLDTVGARNFYAGHDLYLRIDAWSLGSDLGHVYLKETAGLPLGMTPHLICGLVNHGGADESGDHSIDQSNGLPYCYVNPRQYTTDVEVRLRASEDTPPGAYAVDLTFLSKGVPKIVHWAFSVLPPPGPPDKQAIGSLPPPIPNLKVWEDTMTYLGRKWCNPTEAMAWGYEPQIWYYDGGRTYLQLADYTRDPATWYPCANNILNQYRDRIIARNGYYEGWRVFPHGLAMKYWRSGDAASRQALVLLSNGSAYAPSGGMIPAAGMRETAYIIETYVKAEQVGEPRNQYLARAIDLALGQFDQIFVSDPTGHNQIGFDGLLAEALIQYYELTQDPRVPAAIKTMLDWIWENAYDPVTHAFAYNSLLVPPEYVNQQSNLIIPAYAWYWQLTGDPLYLQRGDDLFAHALDTDISYSGKIFNQNYRWSFDYVRWRSGEPLSTTCPAANTPEYVAKAQNHPPVVSAGANLALAWPANSVLLAGSASDPEGAPLALQWTRLRGPGTVTFSAPASASTNATFSTPGAYLLHLAASDNDTSTSASVVVTVGHQWHSSAWTYRKRLTVDHSQLRANLAGFPLAVSLTDPDLRAAGGRVASAGARDLVFTNGANVKVPFEIETYDDNSGRLVAWVKCDLSSAVDTTLYLYFGNPGGAGQQNSRKVWDDDYRAVWHLNDRSGTSWADSTSHGNTGSSPAGPRAVDGVLGGGQKFTGKEYIVFGASAALRLGNDLTWEAWFNTDPFQDPTARTLIAQQTVAPSDATGVLQVTGNYDAQAWITTRGLLAATNTGVFSSSRWYHLAYVRNGIGATSGFYINGAPIALRVNSSGTNFSFTPASGLTYLGKFERGYNFAGLLDEVRISAVARSADWIAAEFANQRPGSTMISAGPLEQVPTGGRPLPPPRIHPTR